MKKFELTRLPPYIILYFKVGKILKNFIVKYFKLPEKIFLGYLYFDNFFNIFVQRFTKNTFIMEKNPTIVNFPVK